MAVLCDMLCDLNPGNLVLKMACCSVSAPVLTDPVHLAAAGSKCESMNDDSPFIKAANNINSMMYIIVFPDRKEQMNDRV